MVIIRLRPKLTVVVYVFYDHDGTYDLTGPVKIVNLVN